MSIWTVNNITLVWDVNELVSLFSQVAGVVGRADLLCGITFILSFLSYYAATHGNHIHSGISAQSHTPIVCTVCINNT